MSKQERVLMSERRLVCQGYFVHADGTVSSRVGWRGYAERRLTTFPNSHGYLRVRMVVHGRRVSRFVHKLVASAFLGQGPQGCQVRHLDGNKLNNAVTNLAWGTAKDNAEDRAAHGRTSRGEDHSAAIKNSGHAEAVRAYRDGRIK